ncbi:exodeoxyribonuclease VII small subunit [Motilimonas cestriensis]|uniref:Exodeoxyribonuclease 7 small subunit n=1 Tax=Motilimonas cestriensis TaxID=2742685 RepID=A0ABS8WDX0_9GAMM|nr:exodeoxyribonuclease VII small subunit [Motilimonas cestriensis]MCE2595893.1 exodeoxyribonuclease VII small subunit [Motilimonas cestriensis]
MAAKKPENMSFEESLGELELIVKKLELGELALEDALKQFERGISLARISSTKLQSAEQQVQILLEQDGEQTLAPFQEDA